MGSHASLSSVNRRLLAIVGAVALLAAAATVSGGTAARASGLGALTVVDTGGEASPSSNWSYDSTTGVLSVTAAVSIDAAALIALLDARDLTVEAASITVSAPVSLVATSGSHDLVLKSQENIVVAPGARIETGGGDIVLWADSAGNLADTARLGGGIQIGVDQTRVGGSNPCPSAPVGAQAVLVSNGGDIILSGGGVSDVAALRATGFASHRVGLPQACSEYYFAVGVFNATIDAGVSSGPGGGSIIIRGNAREFTGMIWTVQVGGAYGAATTLRTTGPGVVEVLGDTGDAGNANPGAACGGSHPSRNPWGIALTGRVTTGQGAITLTGISTVLRPGPRGHSISGIVESASGPIAIIDATEPADPAVVPCLNATATDSNGPYISGAQLGQGSLGSSSSDVTITADRVFFDGSAQVSTTGTFTYEPRGASIQAVNNLPTWSYPFTNLVSTSIGALTIGKPGNTSDVRIGADVPHIPGPIRLYGSTIDIDGTLSTDAALELSTDVAVSQSRPIAVTDLRMSGAGSFTLIDTGNVIGSVAGGTSSARLGRVRVVDSEGGLTVGIPGGGGVASTGSILIETLVGDITVVADLDTTTTTDDAIRVNAGATRVAGDITGGDIILVGARTVSTGAGGVVRLSSGSAAASTGLTTLVGGAANTRTGVDAATTVFDPPLVAGGRYALYRSLEAVVAEDSTVVAEDSTVVPALTLRLACTPDPVVPGGGVTCVVEGGDPSIDILWAAAVLDAPFAGQGIRTDPSGSATFVFTAPLSSAGQRILVSLVEWGASTSVGVTDGTYVPTRVDAGEGTGHRADPALAASLLALLAGAVALGRRWRTGVR